MIEVKTFGWTCRNLPKKKNKQNQQKKQQIRKLIWVVVLCVSFSADWTFPRNFLMNNIDSKLTITTVTRGRTCVVGPCWPWTTCPVEVISVRLVPITTQSILKATNLKQKDHTTYVNKMDCLKCVGCVYQPVPVKTTKCSEINKVMTWPRKLVSCWQHDDVNFTSKNGTKWRPSLHITRNNGARTALDLHGKI